MNALRKITVVFVVFMAIGVKAETTTPGSHPVKGSTVDAEGHPVAGAVVQFYKLRPSPANKVELEVGQQATSDANGSFELDISPASALPQAPMFLIARKPGLAAAWTQFMAAAGTEPRLVLTPSSFLAGRVVDEADKPVAGAEVSVARAFSETVSGDGSGRSLNYLGDKPARDLFTTTTGADGQFRIESFPTNASAALFAEAPGKALRSTGQESFSPDSMPCRAGQNDIRLILEPAGSIEGKIVSAEAGETVPAAQISVLPNGPGAFALGSRLGARSEPDGTFRLNGLAAGPYRIQAAFGTNAVPDWVAETVPVTVESGQATRGAEITAIRGGLLEIAVADTKDGKPVADVAINAYKDGYQTGLSSSTNGVAHLRLPPGDYQVNGFKQGWQPANALGSVETGKTNRVEIELAPPQKLAGIVRSPDGQPATNLAAQVVGDYSMQQANLKTGPDGKFEMDWNSQRSPGNNMTPCLLIRDPERNLAIAQDLNEDTEKLDLRLAPAVSFAARVECDGKPVTNATATLVFWTGNSGMHLNNLSSRTNKPGQIEIVALPPGRRYGLQVSAVGYGSKYVDLAQNADVAKRVELDPVELRLADRKLAGKLVDPDDKPVSGAMVQLNGEGQPNGSTRTDREGRFSFDVCDGLVRLFANNQNVFANISAEAGDTNVVMKLGEQSVNFGGGAKPQKLKGTVTDATGKAVAGADVRVFPMEMPSRSKSDTNGAFSLSYVVQPWQRQQGNPLLIVRDRAHNLAGVQELSDDSTNLTLQLEPALTVKGQVVDPDGKALAKAHVNLMLQANRMGGQMDDQPVTADAQGRFTITALPVGQDYSIYASLPGYSQKRHKVELDGGAKDVEMPPVVLRIANQLIAGQVVNANEKPVSGVYVQVTSDDQPQANMQTDSKGRFKLKVCDGEVHLNASGQNGFAEVAAQAGDTNVVITILSGNFGGGGKPQKLKGTATDADGKPVADADVRVFPMDMPSRSKTDANGAFKVSYVIQPWQRQNGNAWVIIRDRVHNLAAAQELLDENTDVTVQLEPGLTVKGQVVGPDAKPLANAQVNLILQAGRMGGQLDDQPASTDAQGGFKFTALPVAQDYSIYASFPGYGQKHQKIEPDWDTNVVQMPPVVLRIANQIIAGQVVNAKDKPVSGAYVQVSSDDQPQANMQTDSKGRFKFKVCEGPVHMYANGQTGFAQITAEAGETNVVILLTDRSARAQPSARRSVAGARPNVSALKGKPLPDLTSLGFAPDAAPVGKPVLLCLVDVQQRPSRRMTRLLSQQQDALREKNVTVLAAQTVPASDESWGDWKETNPVFFPISRLTEKSAMNKWASSLETLPWLILVDKKGVVADEGFPLEELEVKLQEVNK